MSVKVRVKVMAREAVVAARSGERVEARMEIRERMAVMVSRFHRGQFCVLRELY